MIAKNIRRSAAMLGLVAGAAVFAASSVAFAGSCPADKIVTSGNAQKDVANAPKGVTDTVLTSIELAKEPIGVQDRLFRLRRLVIEPGGVVPWHSHEDRPAIIYIVEGTVTEYASNCSVPIVHKAGDVAPETHTTSHWWKNTGKKTAVLVSADLLHSGVDEHMM